MPIGDALDRVAALWRATRADEIVPRLLALDDGYARFFGRLPKKGPLFGRIVEAAPDRMLGVLLRSVTHGSDSAAGSRLRAVFQAWGADPRIWPFLERWTNTKTYPGGWELDAALQSVLERWDDALAQLPPRRRSNDADREALDHADALIRSMPARHAALALLHDVYAHPDDIERRLVLADALMELGDPWGELIALQCARAGVTGARADVGAMRQREADLLKANGQTWLGRIAPWVREGSVVFEAGFPAALAVLYRARAVGLPEWSTVRELVDPTPNQGAELPTPALLARMPRLRSATVTLIGAAGRLPQLRGGRRLEHLTIRIFSSTAAERVELVREWRRARVAPRLERLDLVDRSGSTSLLEPALELVGSRFSPRLRVLGFDTPITVLLERCAPWIAERRPMPTLCSLRDGSSVEIAGGTLTLKLAGRVDMAAIGAAVRTAKVEDLRVEASKQAWPSVEARRWQADVGATKLTLVRA